MNQNLVSITDLKDNISEIFNHVYYNKGSTIIERYGKPIAKITPISIKPQKQKVFLNNNSLFFGCLPNFPIVTKKRYRKKRKITL
ncbi:type II toxin-antitoxin system Phd/YefM family antitoxin [Patescibacteria group bacterium]|nr:type II toxin-antitoxin system Phd/YefM family antitoxin [Patescibacteria group bacterium]MCG2701667.1 type II toxin-antitoxin system Phd/YefM family antitoxin [Candidatus Parcubacteria bacterium]MBU4210879.1 type II toxin-antitoxin system Phd/YefM family antitoxin [Patescibacteria group bacterium]MBU4265015.1 type II toxin-antitoxin system Phd/YefM family antitoxin [Patescibacteria group bacterium]MBU4390168.1 type II toxin-antitoxin system Phd/YefM family antitoxin [Patescibacteria group b